MTFCSIPASTFLWQFIKKLLVSYEGCNIRKENRTLQSERNAGSCFVQSHDHDMVKWYNCRIINMFICMITSNLFNWYCCSYKYRYSPDLFEL